MPPASAAIAQSIGSRLDRRVSLYAPGAGTWTYREFADPAKRLALRTVEDGRASKSRVVAIKLKERTRWMIESQSRLTFGMAPSLRSYDSFRCWRLRLRF